MERITSLKAATTRSDLASLLGYSLGGLTYIVYKIPPFLKYHCFEIPKRSGGTRTIQAPCTQLKALQRSLADLLQDCLDELEISQGLSDKSIAHGFKRRRSIYTNARRHRNRRFVLNLDLENFFGSLNFGRVRGFFLKNRHFALANSVATLIAQIACHDGALPQGSPCSPVISNLVTHILDIRLARLAAKNHARFTRYADDLTFSTNADTLPNALVVQAIQNPGQWEIGTQLRKEIESFNLKINDSKTRLQFAMSRQEVTGLVTNNRISTRQEYRRVVRAMAHRLFTKGTYFVKSTDGDLVEGEVHSLRGKLAFIDYIDRAVDADAGSDNAQVPRRTEIYRRLVFFCDFFQPSLPVVLFEGKTDRIYFKCAIEQLAFSPLLNAEGEFAVRLHSGGGIVNRFFGLSSGTNRIADFIRQYQDNWKLFQVASFPAPVVIVVDGDSGLKPIEGALKRYKKTLDMTLPFIWICHNLYLICLPEGKAAEDLFPESVLNTKLAGKTFNPTHSNISDTEYGKAYFAEHVVRAQKDKIDFSGFKPILERIALAVKAQVSAGALAGE